MVCVRRYGSRSLRRPCALAAAVLTGLLVPAGVSASHAATSTTSTTVSGTLTQRLGERLPGMRIEAEPLGSSRCTAGSGCVSTYSGPRGDYRLPGLSTGTYQLAVLDGAAFVDVRLLTITRPQANVTVGLSLGPASVPAATAARDARRDLRRLNAERARDRVGSRIVLNPRWSQECAAHDDYEAANSVLQAAENPTAADASAGGAWAGLNGDLAEGRWTAARSPWENAPIHLLALLAPSLAVTGIDDSGTLQCAITFPGMLRRWTAPDTITTVPAPGARNVDPTELARESPFTPVQFVGLPASRTTGRELLVYLNRTGEIGQAPVRITSATLTRAGHPVTVRWVDAGTPTLGLYLAGAIVIPLAPLRPDTTYRAAVAGRDGARTLTSRWSFTTRWATVSDSFQGRVLTAGWVSPRRP
jgi:hypothetical protein